MLVPNGLNPDPRVCQEAKSLASHGYRVTIIGWDRTGELAPEEELAPGVHVRRIGVKSSYGLGNRQLLLLPLFWLGAFRLAWRLQFDTVHCHDFPTLPLGFLIARLRRKPVVFDAHESYHEMLKDNVSPFIKRVIARVERFFVRRLSLLITVGGILEAEYRRRGARRTVVVGNWKRPSEFGFRPEVVREHRRKLRLNGRVVIAFIGFLNQERSIVQLLDAVRESRAVTLLIGGKGELVKEVEAASESADNIRFLGYVPPDEIPLHTAACDAVYYGLDGSNTNHRYSAPNKLFEALAAGKAMLCTDHGEVARIVREKGCGIIMDDTTPESFSQALERLSNRPALRQYQANARSAGRREFRWEVAERTLVAAYGRTGRKTRGHGLRGRECR